MTGTTYKILLFMKRKAGMSMAAFEDYYETRHAPLAEKYSGGIGRYMRRYVTPHSHPETGAWDDIPFDVITELWFDDEKVFEGALGYITTHVMPEEIIADERQLFDRGSFRIATVVERESASLPV